MFRLTTRRQTEDRCFHQMEQYEELELMCHGFCVTLGIVSGIEMKRENNTVGETKTEVFVEQKTKVVVTCVNFLLAFLFNDGSGLVLSWRVQN